MVERSRRQHINMQMILRVMGWLLMIEAGFMIIPLVTAIVFDESNDIRNFSLSAVFTLVAGMLLTFGLHPKTLRWDEKKDSCLQPWYGWFFHCLE